MWIVSLALRRPYTFVVMAILIAVLGVISVVSMPKDIFPYIDIPAANVVWAYSGISPIEMANRITTIARPSLVRFTVTSLSRSAGASTVRETSPR